MSKKQKNYTAEFKAEAIKAIDSNNGSVSETAFHANLVELV